MNVIKATVISGWLELHTSLDSPDGTDVLIDPTVSGVQGFARRHGGTDRADGHATGGRNR